MSTAKKTPAQLLADFHAATLQIFERIRELNAQVERDFWVKRNQQNGRPSR